MAQRLLGGMTPQQFIRKHWQKSPRLVRNAIPEWTNVVVPAQLFELSRRDDVESRLVLQDRNRWQVRHGPFTPAQLRRLPRRGWTLLVQGIDRVLPEAARLMQAFAFIPHARLDDLMASYAPPGGGVGPHFDSYDVFLLQVIGKRDWGISAQRDLALHEHAPLRVLKRFRAQREWQVEPGDLLYLPPGYAHHGVARTPCITLSVGFRAPGAQELGQHFLEFLQDRLQLSGIYKDADLVAQRYPAQIAPAMLRKIARMLDEMRWTSQDVREFAGRFLTEPKPHVVFERPQRSLSGERFAARVARCGVRLALQSRMLFSDKHVYINGESHKMDANDRQLLTRLANTHELPALRASKQTMALLHGWYRAGYLVLQS